MSGSHSQQVSLPPSPVPHGCVEGEELQDWATFHFGPAQGWEHSTAGEAGERQEDGLEVGWLSWSPVRPRKVPSECHLSEPCFTTLYLPVGCMGPGEPRLLLDMGWHFGPLSLEG